MSLDPSPGAIMTDQTFRVYVIQGRGERDYTDCQAAIAQVPALTAWRCSEVRGKREGRSAVILSRSYEWRAFYLFG